MSRFDRWTRSWTRNVLESEARKRGIHAPEDSSQPELLRHIVQHDYDASHGLRDNALRMVGAWLAAARPLLKAKTQEPAPAPRPKPPAARYSPPPQATTGQAEHPSRLVLQRAEAELQVTWDVTPLAVDRARVLLGEAAQQAELALRVVSVRPDPAHVVLSEVSEHGPIDANGVWTILLPSAQAHCVSSVGVRHGEHFVSIVHESSRGRAS